MFLAFIFFLLIIGYPISEKKFWAKDDLVWLGFSINIPEKCGIFEAKRGFALAKLQLLKGILEPSQNKAQSVAVPLQWVSQMCPWIRPFLASLYAFFENKKEFGKDWRNRRIRIKIWEVFLKRPRFITPKSFLAGRINLEIYTDACAKSPFGKDAINWTSGIGIGGES